MLVDKSCIQQVLGCLIKRPQFLSEVDKYSLTLADFSNRFERYLFNAIQTLYKDYGVSEITPVDIDNTLSTNEGVHRYFEEQNGLEYIEDAIELSNTESFSYYYNKLKKLNLLRDLQKQGIDIQDFYVEDLTNPRANEINSKFDNLTTVDIINGIKGKLLKLESSYAKSEEVVVETIADGIDNFIEEISTTIDVGKPIQGNIYSQVINGAQRGCLTIRSGSSGLGKTRQAVGDACALAFPLRYNILKKEWEQYGNNEKVLFIVTEQTIVQIKKMILAYLTGINESKFKYAQFTKEEDKLIKQAADIIKKYEANFTILKIPNPTIELIKTLVRENVLTRDIGYVFYDYIFIGPSLLGEFRGFSLRNDEVLLMFATALKDLAVELNVCMMTSTQVNASADDNKTIRNEASLAGGRSTINKADNGAIMARPTKEELDFLKEATSQYGTPNMVTDVFKVRSGAWSQVRIWSKVDLGTMRKEDLFITDDRFEPIQGFFTPEEYRVVDWTSDEQERLSNYINSLNK